MKEREEKNYLADRHAFKLAFRKKKFSNMISRKRNPTKESKDTISH